MLGEFGKQSWVFTADMNKEMTPTERRVHEDIDAAYKAGYHSAFNPDHNIGEQLDPENPMAPGFIWWNMVMARMAGLIAAVVDRAPRDVFGTFVNLNTDYVVEAVRYRMSKESQGSTNDPEQ